jgi:hypothetical protein
MEWGKINVDDKQGKEVNVIFNKLTDIDDKKFVPFRTKDNKIYDEQKRSEINAKYWAAITSEPSITAQIIQTQSITAPIIQTLSNDGMKKLMITRAFESLFKKTDQLLVFKENGDYVRFLNLEDVDNYYINRIHETTFECRANQANPIALYCKVLQTNSSVLQDPTKDLMANIH